MTSCGFGILAFYSDRDIRHEWYNHRYPATKEDKILSQTRSSLNLCPMPEPYGGVPTRFISTFSGVWGRCMNCSLVMYLIRVFMVAGYFFLSKERILVFNGDLFLLKKILDLCFKIHLSVTKSDICYIMYCSSILNYWGVIICHIHLLI